jgi:hypothetical protein
MSEETEVSEFCEKYGYGRVMQIASQKWSQKAVSIGLPGSGFVIGPCENATIPCGCNPQEPCEWCCGAGWLTKHVKSLKEA